jgi:alpha-ribazole phosphatase
MSKKTIYLIRHGEIESAGEKRYIGIKDVALSMNGIAQARRLKAFFDDIDIKRVYCSSLMRTIETSNIIIQNKDVKLIKLNELREINMGSWEGETFKDIKTKFPEEFEKRIKEIGTFKPDGGESFLECQKRVINIYEKISHEDFDDILVVAHAGVNRLIISYILHMSINDIFKLRQDYGCINKIDFDGSNFNIEYINHTL